jgi:hypothetical protein
MRTIMDEVCFHDIGNEVSLVKYSVRHGAGDVDEATAAEVEIGDG